MCGWDRRSLVPEHSRREQLRLNCDPCLGPDPGEQSFEVPAAEGDASRRRRPIRPRQVQEHRAAAAGDPGTGVVVDLDDEVVEVVLPPQAVAWFIGRAAERAVVAAVSGIFAPGKVGCDALHRQEGRGRGWRSARHHSRTSRNRPRGVAPSPSILLARMPARPSTTGMASGPASSTPRVRVPGRVRTRIREKDRFRTEWRARIQGWGVSSKQQTPLALLPPNALLRARHCGARLTE